MGDNNIHIRMIKATIIAKTANGEVLFETVPTKGAPADTVKACAKAKEMLKSISHKPDRLSVELAGDNVFK